MSNIILQRIDQLIRAEGLSYRQFDIKMGFSDSFISRRINEDISIGSDKMLQIYRSFNVSGDWLFGADVPMRRESSIQILSESKMNYKKLNAFEMKVLKCFENDDFRAAVKELLQENDSKKPHSEK